VRVREAGERFPLTIADADPVRGAVRLVVQVVGRPTQLMADLTEGGELLDLVGPLGKPTEIECFGTVAMVCGGIGVAPSYPIAQAMKLAGNRVVSIIGACFFPGSWASGTAFAAAPPLGLHWWAPAGLLVSSHS